jgi:protein pelota
VQEILADEALISRIANTKAVGEVKALNEFFEMLGNDSTRAFYGPGHVVAAAEQGAIAKLLISDAMYRYAAFLMEISLWNSFSLRAEQSCCFKW